jgi:hypothetical protein
MFRGIKDGTIGAIHFNEILTVQEPSICYGNFSGRENFGLFFQQPVRGSVARRTAILLLFGPRSTLSALLTSALINLE